MSPVSKKPDNFYDTQDEVINVTLPKDDYVILREIIDRQKSLNWLGSFIRRSVFVAATGLLALVAFGEQIKKYFGF